MFSWRHVNFKVVKKNYTLDTPFKIVSVKLHAVLWCNNGNVNVYAHRFPEKIYKNEKIRRVGIEYVMVCKKKCNKNNGEKYNFGTYCILGITYINMVWMISWSKIILQYKFTISNLHIFTLVFIINMQLVKSLCNAYISCNFKHCF